MIAIKSNYENLGGLEQSFFFGSAMAGEILKVKEPLEISLIHSRFRESSLVFLRDGVGGCFAFLDGNVNKGDRIKIINAVLRDDNGTYVLKIKEYAKLEVTR